MPGHPDPSLPPLPTGEALPPLQELLADAVVVAQPMRTRFRGTTVREAMLLRGPHGWAEFSPFPEYGAQESSRWLAAAVEAGWQGWPDPVRDHVPVNATVPALPAADVGALLERFGAVPAVKVKVAEQPAPGTAPDPHVHGVDADLALSLIHI